ncbi:hypothetical protein [Mangrovicoccus algicola]|uniref:Uncharacterized protein n=1 Tax=Mangrovicoccus algicola TaxID=2771008 RepID=A0A8J6YTG7_9RHOB|nr:hypothetical protein [Mangrovicoccus algicola]MBE3637360.1 hypothetical protein [Mangrovicoccus algicola]
MPVLRKPIEINSGANVRPLAMSRSAAGDLMTREAGRMAQRAAQYGQAMAAASQEEGQALARAATFSTSESGMPQMPDASAQRMSAIARQTYDGAMQERMGHAMATSIRGRISAIENLHPYDLDAFQEEAASAIADMRGDIPEGFEGFFEDTIAGAMVSTGASIGQRQGQLEIRNAASRAPVMVDDQIRSVRDAVMAGDDARAAAMAANTQWIDELSPAIMTDGDKAELKQRIRVAAGMARMTRDLGVEELSPGALMDLQARLLSGGDEELNEYFTLDDGTVDRDAMRTASGVVTQFIGNANRRQAAVEAAAQKAYDLSILRRGGATSNPKNRGLLDEDLANALELRTEDGLRRGIDMADWLTMEGEDRKNAVALVKDAGFLPDSMRQLFDRMNTNPDPAELAAGFELIRDVIEGPNSAGRTTNLGDQLPDDLAAVYGLVSDLHGDGSFSQEGVERAVAKVWALRDEPWDETQLARLMNAQNRRWEGRGQVDADTAPEILARDLRSTLYEGEDIQPTPEEERQAASVFTTYMRLGRNYDDALDMTRQSMEGRYVTSDYMGGVRSAYSPEKFYEVPYQGIGDMLAQLGGEAAGWVVGGLGFPRAGANIAASPFEAVADQRIREMIGGLEDSLGREAFESGASGDRALIDDADFLRPGEDYYLVADTGRGTPPVYTVMMNDETGRPYPVGTLDVREDMAALQQADQSLAALMKAGNLGEREWKIIGDEIVRAAEAGESPRPPQEILREHFEKMRGTQGPRG